MNKLQVEALPSYYRAADKLMIPIMWMLRGFKTDSLQETHPWHVQPIDPTSLDMSLTQASPSGDRSKHRPGHLSFLFHAPIFGGWRNYSVYEVEHTSTPFHIGWVIMNHSGDLIEAAVQRLPIYDAQIRTLDGPAEYDTRFFALNAEGEQVPLRAVDHGQLNDGKHLDVRLF